MILFMQEFDNEKLDLVDEPTEVKDVFLHSVAIDAVCTSIILGPDFDPHECFYAQINKSGMEELRHQKILFRYGIHFVLTRSMKFISGYHVVVLKDGFSFSPDSVPEELKKLASEITIRDNSRLAKHGPVGFWFQPPSDPTPNPNKLRLVDHAHEWAGVSGTFVGAIAAAYTRHSN